MPRLFKNFGEVEVCFVAEDYNVREAAAILRISQDTLVARILAKKIRAYNVGTDKRHRWRIQPEAIEDFKASTFNMPPKQPKVTRPATIFPIL